MSELRLALRQLARRPVFTATAALTLALGIGATTAMFSVVDGVVLRRLPVREQDRVVVMWTDDRLGDFPPMPFTHAGFTDIQERSRTLSAVAAHPYWGVSETVLREGGAGVSLRAAPVSGNFFDVLGVRPVPGRLLEPGDDRSGAARVAVISHGLWRRMFGGDPAVLGRRLNLGERDYTVVGVAPDGLEYPQGADVWHAVLPLLEPDSPYLSLDLVGRLAPDATLDAARAELDVILHQLTAEGRGSHEGQAIVLHPLPTQGTSP
jgi:hypothetical protein